MAVENRVYDGCLARPLPVWRRVRRVDEIPDGTGHDGQMFVVLIWVMKMVRPDRFGYEDDKSTPPE